MRLKASSKIFAGLVPFILTACGPDMAPQQPTGTEGQLPTDSAQKVAEGAIASLDKSTHGSYADNGQVHSSQISCAADDSDPSCSCPDCTGRPPPPPPSVPADMTYTPFSESSSMTVSWKPTSNTTYYQLQRNDSGNWSTVYSGPDTSVTLGLYTQGLLTYRVRACNNYGCSNFLTDKEMRFSKGPERTDNPGILNVQAFLSAMGYDTPATLGLGYDNLRQELTPNTCLDMSKATTADTPARMKEFRLDMAHTRDELSTLLNLTQNLGISAKYGMFSGSYSNKKELLSTSTRVDETYMVVASLRDQFNVKSITNPSALPLDATQLGLLQTNQGTKFRNRCGDGYVYSIAYGRQFYVAFQLSSFEYTRDEIRTQTQNLKLDIGSFVSANYGSTQKTQLTQKYNRYNVKASIVSYGSSIAVSGVVSLDAALQFMKDFEAEPVSNGSYPIDIKTADYEAPAGGAYPYYQSYKSTLQRWYSFDQQIAQRCAMFDDTLYGDAAINLNKEALSVGGSGGLSLRDSCFYLKRAILENIQNCEDTTKWSQCIQPDSSACIVPGTDESCLSYANRLPYWSAAPASLSFNVKLGTGLSSSSTTASANACLYGTYTMRDLRTGSVDCAGQNGCPWWVQSGVIVRNSDLLNASNGWNSWNSGTKCLHAEVTITRPGWWSSSAHAYQLQIVNGLSPQSLSYLF